MVLYELAIKQVHIASVGKPAGDVYATGTHFPRHCDYWHLHLPETEVMWRLIAALPSKPVTMHSSQRSLQM